MSSSSWMSLCLLLLGVSVAQAANWAVLVAGSNGYYNYRHQADICHSYQVLKANGFDDDRIITMFYDDIASNNANPVKDNLINQPDGPNVYQNCKKDYTGSTVTPKNFLDILEGRDMTGIGSGKTLQSTEADDVFIFFSDHGATGLVAFPTSELSAHDFNKTLTYMYENKKYKQMLIYIEACESGSMFNGILSSNINVLAITASDPDHSSYAIYWDDLRQTYLGDVFSVFWMQDSEAHASETVGQQFITVRAETNTSLVCAYGDTSIETESLLWFQGTENPSNTLQAAPRAKNNVETVDSRDVELWTLRHRLTNASPAERPRIAAQLDEVVARRKLHDSRIQFISLEAAALVNTEVDFVSESNVRDDVSCTSIHNTVRDPVCHKAMVAAMKEACGAFDDYSLKYVRVLNTMCNHGVDPVAIKPAMAKICNH